MSAVPPTPSALPNETPEMDRRACLAWLARATVASAVLACGCDVLFAGEPEKGRLGGGVLARYPKLNDLKQGATLVRDEKIILVRTAKGVAAFPAVCTHRNNPLDVDDLGNIVCPTHGSDFDLEGKPTSGPAARALKWYKVTVGADGSIAVDSGSSVDAGTWVK
jgi:nitrite reductase/ring-hydroxylating ferredoxin subunit